MKIRTYTTLAVMLICLFPHFLHAKYHFTEKMKELNVVNIRENNAMRTEPEVQQNAKNPSVILTQSDITIAQEIIDKNTMTLPGFNTGSSYKTGPGPFCISDALVIYMLKFHQMTNSCPPIAVVAESLKQITDTEFNKKAVAIYWQEYSNYKDVEIDKPDFLYTYFELYILTKHTSKLKINNARLQGYVGADETWRNAITSQQKNWQISTERENEFILTRDAYRVILNTQAAIDAAAKAVSGSY